MVSGNKYRHLFNQVRDANRGGRDAWGVLSTGEKVAVALNQQEWLTEYGCMIAEAIDRCGAAWVSVIPRVARDLADEEGGTE